MVTVEVKVAKFHESDDPLWPQIIPDFRNVNVMVWPFPSSESKPPTSDESTEVVKDEATPKPTRQPISDHAKSIRREKLKDAINENCALDSVALLECQDSWSLWNRFTLCQVFQSRYMDCLTSQRVRPNYTCFDGRHY